MEKRLVLKREIRIRKRSTSETVEITASLRKQRAEVERQHLLWSNADPFACW